MVYWGIIYGGLPLYSSISIVLALAVLNQPSMEASSGLVLDYFFSVSSVPSFLHGYCVWPWQETQNNFFSVLKVGYLGLAVGYGPIFGAGVDRVYEGWQREYSIFLCTVVYLLPWRFLCLSLCASISWCQIFRFFSFQEKAALGFHSVTRGVWYFFTTSYLLPRLSRPYCYSLWYSVSDNWVGSSSGFTGVWKAVLVWCLVNCSLLAVYYLMLDSFSGLLPG